MAPTTDPPHTLRRVALPVTGAVAVALLVALTRAKAPAARAPRANAPAPTTAAPTATPGGCHFAVGDVRAWRLSQRMTQDGRALTALSAVLTLRATAVDATTGAVLHAATIAAVETDDEALRGQLGALRNVPFALRMGSDCTFGGAGFAASTDAAGARAVRGLVQPFEVSMPTGEAPPRWLTQQRDGTAEVSVRYQRVESGFERQRLRYVASDARSLTPEIVRSSARFAMADDGRWLASLDGVEETRLRVGEGRPAVQLRVTIELRAVPSTWTGETPAAAALAAMDFTEHALPEAPAEEATDPALALDLEPAVAHLGELFDRRHNGAAEEAVGYLVAYLRAHPERAMELLRWIRRRSYPERLGALTFFAMGRVNDPRVVEALASTAEDDGFLEGERVRAAVALSDNPGATVDHVSRLARVAERPHASGDAELVSDGALNAIGAIRARSEGPVAEAASQVLRDTLDRARTPDAQSDALDAIGNSRDTGFVPAARDALASDSPRVRESAAGALANMDDASVEAALRERLRVETDPAVSVVIVRAILTRTERRPGAETVAVAAARLPREASVDVRLALVELLGAAAVWSGDARVALAQWYPRESDARVQVAIGRYLPAESLGPAHGG